MSQTVAEVFAQTLKSAGIEQVFGLPGGENAELMDAIRREGIDFVLVRNESSAVFMADSTARLTGKPGVCLTTLGPGAANAFAGVAHAWLDRAPILIVTAQSISRLLDHHTHQVLDLQAIFHPVTKMTEEVTTNNVASVVEEALRLTTDGRPGPVHLGVSSEMAGQVATLQEHVNNGTQSQLAQQSEAIESVQLTITRGRPSPLDVAREQLAASRRPVVICGLGMEPEGCYEALQEFAEATNAPVIVTPKGKGAIHDDHPLAGGIIGLTRVDPAYEIIDDSDCIIAVGYDVVELVKPWNQPQPLIWVAPWANEDPIIKAETELIGPMGPTLQQLTDSEMTPDSSWGPERIEALRQKLAQTTVPEPSQHRMNPQSVLQAIRTSVPRDTLVATDVGSHKILTALTWPALAHNRYMVSNGLSAMGFGLPAAAAACRVLGQPTVCVTGDAGMGMVIGELNMVTQEELPVIIVVMNDSALDLIRAAQNRIGKPTFGTEFPNPDFVAVAHAYGLAGYRVTSKEECAAAVQQAISTNRPTLIDAVIDPASYPTTPGFVWGE
ncbi:MAG: thiamine pyrophosphate-binding protein [Chloroflexota bacterium]